jgi:two-component system cell cycle sensor histidine kinase/response regulator CckA
MVREARKTRPDLPILFMSGYAEEQLRKSIDIDNVAFLPKPFSVQELAGAVRNALAAENSK